MLVDLTRLMYLFSDITDAVEYCYLLVLATANTYTDMQLLCM